MENNNKSKGFLTCQKEKYEKEKYSRLENTEIKNTLSKLRLSSFKVALENDANKKKQKRE